MFINIQMKMHLALSICLLLFLQTVVVKANELPEFELYSENSFFYTDEIEGVLFLDGEITNDMYGEFRRALVENNIHTLVLNSPGGNLYEGLQMAGTIFDRQLTTYIPEGADCASACSIMYLAGKKRYSRGQLGVHQSAYSDDVSKQKDVVGKIDYESQITTADIIQHLEEFGTPGFVYVKMLRTPPEDMYFFDEDELDKLGNQSINTKDKQEFAKIDQFLNFLYAKLEIISCRENASSCSDESLCKYASKDKAWLSSQEAADYVREALNRNLSCGVPEAQCPEDLRKCNDAYICTKATKLDPYLPAWANNEFTDEAKLRELKCGVTEKVCPADLKKCNAEYICNNATKSYHNPDGYSYAWANNNFSNEAIDRGLTCGVENGRYLIDEIKFFLKMHGCNVTLGEFGWLDGLTRTAIKKAANSLNFYYDYPAVITLDPIYLQSLLEKIVIFNSNSKDVNLCNESLKGPSISQIVKELQFKLSDAECYAGQIDGVFGINTSNALEDAALELGLDYSTNYVPSKSYIIEAINLINKKLPSSLCQASMCSYENIETCSITRLCKLAYNETDWFEGVYYQKAVSAAKELKLNCSKINSNY